MLSIANRLAMLFGAITLGVIAVVYVYVVPPLESSLRNQRLSSLAATAKQSVGQVRSDVVNGVDVRELNRDVSAASDASNARVTCWASMRPLPNGRPKKASIRNSSRNGCTAPPTN